MTENSDFAARLRKARKAAGLTQDQLSEKCGISTISIRQYESGRREPKLCILKKIAQSLGVSCGYLIGE